MINFKNWSDFQNWSKKQKMIVGFLILLFISLLSNGGDGGDSSKTSYFKKETIYETSKRNWGNGYGCGGRNTHGNPYFFVIDSVNLAFQSFGGEKNKKGQPCLVKYSMNDSVFTIKGSVDCRFYDCYDNWIGDYVFIKPYEWSDGSLHEEGMWVNQNNENFLIEKSVYSSIDYVFSSYFNKTWGIK
jgi:hypothetical protein